MHNYLPTLQFYIAHSNLSIGVLQLLYAFHGKSLNNVVYMGSHVREVYSAFTLSISRQRPDVFPPLVSRRPDEKAVFWFE